jgi:hypothetical protein
VARTQIDQAEQAAKARLEESMAAAAVKVTEIMTRVADIGVTEETLLARVTLLREEAKATSDRIDMLRADERTVSETLQGLYQEVNIQRAREALSQTFVGSYIRTAEHLRRMEIELRKSGTKIEFTHDTEAVSYTTTLYGRTPDGSRLLVVKTTPMLSRLKNFLQGVNEYLILNGMENEADQKILMLIADIEVNIVEQLLAMMPSSTETTPTQHITAEDIAKFIHTHPVETQQIQIQTTKKIGIEFVSGPDN